eukprot:80294-Chlamydomonas_euryale.AAC.1
MPRPQRAYARPPVPHLPHFPHLPHTSHTHLEVLGVRLKQQHVRRRAAIVGDELMPRGHLLSAIVVARPGGSSLGLWLVLCALPFVFASCGGCGGRDDRGGLRRLVGRHGLCAHEHPARGAGGLREAVQHVATVAHMHAGELAAAEGLSQRGLRIRRIEREEEGGGQGAGALRNAL